MSARRSRRRWRSCRTTGSLKALEKLASRYPPGLVEIMHLPGVGAKTTRKLHARARSHRHRGTARGVRGRPRSRPARAGQQSRGEDPRGDRGGRRRHGRGRSCSIGPWSGPTTCSPGCRAHPACVAASEAGSLRRRRETVGDIDLIAASGDPPALLDAFCALAAVAEVTRAARRRPSIVTHDSIQVDLRVVPPESYGNLLQHFTGSKAHNVAMREEAVQRGLSISEWGIEDQATGVVFRTVEEDEVYRHLGYQPIPPELREDAGELEAARAGELPGLVALTDIRGDLHTHTTASDGHDTIEAMAAAAIAARLRLPGGHRSLGRRRHGHRPGGGRHARGTPLRIREPLRSRSGHVASPCSRARRSTSWPTPRSTTRITCCRSWTGSSRACTSPSGRAVTG